MAGKVGEKDEGALQYTDQDQIVDTPVIYRDASRELLDLGVDPIFTDQHIGHLFGHGISLLNDHEQRNAPVSRGPPNVQTFEFLTL